MTEQFANFAQTTLASSCGSGDATVTVASATQFPTIGNFRLVVQTFDSNGNATSNAEIMLVTSVSGNVFTVSRAQESTTALAFPSGAQAANVVTAAVMQGLQGGGLSLNAYSLAGNNTNAPATAASVQFPILGTPGYVTSGVNFAQLTQNSNNFAQLSLQNTNSGSSASSDFVATADDGSDTTHYVDFGINNSTGGSTAFTNAHAGYIYSVDNEFDIGALGASGVVNIYTTGGAASPVLAATFTTTQGLTLTSGLAATFGTFTGVISTSQAGASSAPAFSMTGAPFVGTGTTSVPLFYINNGATVSSWTTTGGTFFGINGPSGFGGNYIDIRTNGGGTTAFTVASTGTVTAGSFSTAGGISSTRSPGVSASAMTFSGALQTGGNGTTNFPHILLQPTGTTAVSTYSTGGTGLGMNLASTFVGNFLDFHINGGGSVFLVGSGGGLIASGNISGNSLTAGAAQFIGWGGVSRFLSPSDGMITLSNNAQTGFTRLQFGGTTSSFPALAVSGTGLIAQLADASANANFTANNLIAGTAGGGLQIKSGSNARIGTGTLSGGTLAVANTSVTANTRVFLQDTSAGALTNVGSLTVVTSAGVGFTVTSTNVLDVSTFNYMLVESN